ncbi:radical SAM family heme chaperone HemW [Candidatus Poriferisodalis sp.]|uniref:radical SAM family heme chaperone HemW n=1 Tax=Candidatus Poriferisodalis sp. TaxID=3101277 RepID=UPI003B018359
MRVGAPQDFGVYCHIPFCSHRCDYCAFATWTDRRHLIDDYMACCSRQARELAADMPAVTSVFFGGGTPNLVPPPSIGDVLGELPVAPGAEITVECNPDFVTAEQMREYRSLGVNRISLGVQSAVAEVLESLGRRHSPAMVTAAVDAVRCAGIDRLSLDLIYGSVAESPADWQYTLVAAIDLEPDHLSVYGLTPEPGTALGDDPQRRPDDDDMADKYLLADELLASAGYVNYEISNWARPGAQCRHSLLYWQQGEYAGIGCAAHSHRSGRRYWNLRTPERFIAAVSTGASPVAGTEQLNVRERRVESLQLALRTSAGVPAEVVPDDVAHLVAPSTRGRVRLTARGRLLANEVALRLDPRERAG